MRLTKRSHLKMTTRLSKTDVMLLASLGIVLVGSIVFYGGLHNPFMGDDNAQIVINVPVHSITNIKLFFEGGTFYSGDAKAPLVGAYYRPLMTTIFSLLYTLFGPHAYYFHFFQLLLVIASAILLYLFFRYFFQSTLAFVLALIFLVHPINSQVVYAIPSMQDALFFFFGILALNIVLHYTSVKSLALASLCLLLSLLSKETGILFVVMALIYLFWHSRKRFKQFLALLVLPLFVYLILKVQAIGWFVNPANAPIDNLNLGERLLNAPAILLFYITKFIYPAKLASAYYWTYPRFSFSHVMVPLLLDILAILLTIATGVYIHRKGPRSQFLAFLFFAAWAAFGLGMLLQLVPLDMTVSETWFYFPMVGILGMIGVLWSVSQAQRTVPLDARTIGVALVIVLSFLGTRTALRSSDWQNPYTLAAKDVQVSKDDYTADAERAIYYYERTKYQTAKTYALSSVAIYPTSTNRNILGSIYLALSNFEAASRVLKAGLPGANNIALIDTLASLTSIIHVYGNMTADQQFLMHNLHSYPDDANLWFYLAILEYRENNPAQAKHAIAKAYKYAPSNAVITIDYFRLMTNKSPDYTFNSNPVAY